MADIDNIEKKLDLILQNQKELQNKISKMENVINKIESDIYLDDSFDFEIVCPYCNNEFVVDMDEDKTEVTCPECENVIELDWTGDLDGFECEHDGCAGCHGCGPANELEDEDNEEDDM